MSRNLRIAALFFLLSTSVVVAQTSGTIAGTVRDATGAQIQGVSITVTNTETQAVRVAVSNNDGLYNIPALPPGTYTVKAESNGFGSALHPDVLLQVEQTAEIDFTLQPGSVSQTVEVSAAPPQLNTQDSSLGTVVDNQRIVNLPLNGRDFLQLIALSPNVTTGFGSPGQATLRQGGSRSTENYSVMGLRGTANYYTLDGISNTDVNFNLIIMQPSVDALQEFKVQTGIYPAEFGREAAQINVLTKSGTNQFHGTVYEFLRNDFVDARQYNFLAGPPPPKNPFRWNQYGYTLGGPVLIPKLFNGRDKLFFMSNYEGYRVRQSTNTLYTVATPEMREGIFTNLLPGNQLYNPATKTYANGVGSGTPFPNNVIPPADIDPVSVKLMAYLPAPNINTSILNNNYETADGSPVNKDQVTERVDWIQNDKSSWFGRYNWTNENSLSQGIYKNGGTVLTNANQGVLGYTHVFSANKVNDARFGINIFHNTAGTELGGVLDVVDTLGIPGLSTPLPSSWGIPQVGSFTDGISTFGNTTSAPFVLSDETFQWIDNFSWTIGRHALRMGADVRRDHYDYYGNEFSRGQFLFEGTMTRSPYTSTGGEAFADFLTGYCFTCADATTLAVTDQRATSQAYYFEDTWNVLPKLTIAYGLRYEFVPPWYDQSQNVVNTITPQLLDQINVTTPSLQPTLYRAGTGDFYQGHETVRYAAPIQTVRQSLYGGRLLKSDYDNFGPRLGIVYNPSPTWVVRTGFGIFYSQDSGIEYFDMARGWGRINATGNPQQPNVNYHNFIVTNGGQITLTTPNVYGIIPNLRTPYMEQYILNLQHDIGSSTVLEVNYSGSVGRHLNGLQNMNPAIPGAIGTPQSRSPFPYLGIIQVLQSGNISSYNAFSVKGTRRLKDGLTYLASYTWSKSLDDGSAIRGTSTDILPQDSRCLICDYGYSSFNIPNRFVTSVLYDLPFGKGRPFANTGGIVNQVIGGWQVASIVTWQSGLPINTDSSVDTAGTSGYGEVRLDSTGISPNLPKGKRTLAHWFNPAAFALPAPGTFGNMSRNNLEGPSFFDWDASAIKTFPIHESQALEFRFEMFNAPNHPNWASPNPNWSSSTPKPGPAFLSITSTANAPNSMREIQGALKFIF
jgi:Carboxypeptidase regulatory-like domain